MVVETRQRARQKCRGGKSVPGSVRSTVSELTNDGPISELLGTDQILNLPNQFLNVWGW